MNLTLQWRSSGFITPNPAEIDASIDHALLATPYSAQQTSPLIAQNTVGLSRPMRSDRYSLKSLLGHSLIFHMYHRRPGGGNEH
jgi:hypothetical protein